MTLEAAKKLSDYLHSIRPVNEISVDIRQRANAIANEALEDDEGLLAIAIAAPSIKLAVVQFRQAIGIPIDVASNSSYLSAYWRGLSEAWNQTENIQFWSAPFRDCSALRGRWLWPFNINYANNGIK